MNLMNFNMYELNVYKKSFCCLYVYKYIYLYLGFVLKDFFFGRNLLVVEVLVLCVGFWVW